MKDIFIYKDFSLISEIEKIKDLCYNCTWTDAPNSELAYNKCKELLQLIRDALEVKIEKKKFLEVEE